MRNAWAIMGLASVLAACSTTLEQDLDEPQADAIVVALGEHGIGATKEADRAGGGFRVLVLESDVAGALAVLREEGLPRLEAPGVAEAYAEPSLVPTAGEERARLAAAVSADLVRSIESLAGVHDARVHLGLPDPSVLPIDDAPPEVVASVLVHVEDGSRVDEAAIRALVAGAVPGLAPERVAVVSAPLPPARAHTDPLVAIGPIHVTAGSAPLLRAALGLALAVNVLLAVAIGVVMRRRR